MDVDLDIEIPVDDGAPTLLTQEEIDELSESDKITSDDDMSAPLVAQPSPSAAPSNPLTGAPEMSAALDDIRNDVPSSRTNISNRSGDGINRANFIRSKLEALEAQRQVEAARKAEADKAAATGHPLTPRPDKRNLSMSTSTEDNAGKKAKNDHSVPVTMDMRREDPARARVTSFDHLFKPDRVRCALVIEYLDIIGNPFSFTPGWEVRVALEPGTLGQPSIGLDFQFGKDGNWSSKPKDLNSFTVGWEPGVKIADQWMMEDLKIFQAYNPGNPAMRNFTFPDQIRQMNEGQSRKDHVGKSRDQLICMTFKSNVHKTSPMRPEWALELKDGAGVAPYNSLMRMYGAEDPTYQVTLWFYDRNRTIQEYYNGVLLPLVEAVANHTPPLHQYLDIHGNPFIDFDLPTIREIGNGMYARYPKVKDAAGKMIDDRSRTPTYINLPKTVTWDSIRTFHITFGVPIVRDMQYSFGVVSRLEDEWHHVFLQRLPAYSVDGKNIQPDPKMKDTYRAGIRMTRDPKTGLKDAVPAEGSTILFDFYNGNVNENREHESNDDNRCFGRVTSLGGRAWLEKTKTDFCVLMTRPRNFRQKLWSYPEAKDCADKGLLRAKLEVKVNVLPAIRDKDALAKFCDPKFEPELLDRIRLAFWSQPDELSSNIDLTRGPAHNRSEANAKAYMDALEELQKEHPSNESQIRVLEAAANMKSNIVAVQGPPGAGKTRTLRNKVIALAKAGHKIACVAGANVAVDAGAIAVWRGFSAEDKTRIKCLRLETDGAEKAQRLTKIGYAQYTGSAEEAEKMPEYLGPEEAANHPAIRNHLDKICMEVDARQEYAKKMLAQLDSVDQVYKAMQHYDDLKQSNVPNGMTLDYRIWEITRADLDEAEAAEEAHRKSLTPAEYNRQLGNGQISVAMYDKSLKYKQCVANYVSKNGKISQAERLELQNQSNAMIERVLANTHILFSTASNCGGELLEDNHSFEPTVIFCDEAGQISIPSLCVPLTTFTKWESLFLFGDTQQLEPPALSGQFNEFIANAKTSPLGLLAIKNFDSYLLDTQYRMAPQCSQFPRWQFYDNKGLKDSDMVKEDNEVRQAVRGYTHGLGVQGPHQTGSEYMVLDVANGCSRVELNGTSLVNHANADVIIGIIDALILTGEVKASMIKVLTYYQGQRRLLKRKIAEQKWPKAIKDAIGISTVDAYQGNETRVIIVDFVAAKDRLTGPAEQDTPDDAEDLGGEDYIKAGAITGHVRSPNRLNVGLTRGQDSTMVVCQAALLMASRRKGRGKHQNALYDMINDARTRNCVVLDPTEDTHPDSVQLRERMGRTRVQRTRKREAEADLKFIADGKINWQQTRHRPSILAPEPFKHYRRQGGHTTRPIGNPELVAKADAFDEERQVERAKAESLAVEALEEENRRRLNLGISQSLDFPPLPPAKEKATTGRLTTQEPSALGQTSTLDPGRGDGQDDVEDHGLFDPPSGSEEEEGEENGTAHSDVEDAYKDLKAGEEGNAWD